MLGRVIPKAGRGWSVTKEVLQAASHSDSKVQGEMQGSNIEKVFKITADEVLRLHNLGSQH